MVHQHSAECKRLQCNSQCGIERAALSDCSLTSFPGVNKDRPNLGAGKASGWCLATSVALHLPPGLCPRPALHLAAHMGGRCTPHFQQLLLQALGTIAGKRGGWFSPSVDSCLTACLLSDKLRSLVPPARTLPVSKSPGISRSLRDAYCLIRVFFFHTVCDPLELWPLLSFAHTYWFPQLDFYRSFSWL